MINLRLLAIAIFFFASMVQLADFVHSLRFSDKENRGESLAVCSSVLFLLITWGEW